MIIQVPFCHRGSLASLFVLHVTSKFRHPKSGADTYVISSKKNAGTLVVSDMLFLRYINRNRLLMAFSRNESKKRKITKRKPILG